MNVSKIRKIFIEMFDRAPQLFQSPGRINLIGEHTDYNDGFVLPAAIDKKIVAAIAPNKTKDRCHLYAYDLNEHYNFEIDQLKALRPNTWPNYILGVVDEFIKKGKRIQGFDCVIGGDIPLGAGLSSSAALECVVAFGLDHIFQTNLLKIELIHMAQTAEHNYAGVQCGIMDQFASMMGKKDFAFKLDCRSLEYDYFPLQMGDYQLLLINSNVKHSLASSEYNTRRNECATGLDVLKKTYPPLESLRDVSAGMLETAKDQLDPVIYKRCKFIIEENERVLSSCRVLIEGDLVKLGEYIYASHEGLSKEYEVSCPELDYLVEQTRDKDYVLGARMMGGGFGGCSLNIIRKDMVERFLNELTPRYSNAFGTACAPIEVQIEDGTKKL